MSKAVIWKYDTIGNVCKTGSGGTPLKSHSDYYENGDIPWLQSGEVNNKSITESKNFITEKGLKNSSARVFPANSVLVAMYGATAGQIGILRFPASSNQAVCAIYPNENFVCDFIYYSLLNKKQELINKAVGNAQPNISQIKIKETEIAIIPISEQQAIVDKLNFAFDAIEKAKANIEKNIENAKELFQSKLNEIFSQKGEGWEEKKLSEVFKMKSGVNLTSKMMKPDGEFPVFGGNNIAGYYDEYNFEKGVIVGRVGALCGNVRFIDRKIWITDNAFKLTDFMFKLDFAFLTYLLNYKNLREYARQTAQPVISNSSLKDVILNFPKSLQEQEKIVLQLDLLSEQTNLLQEKYKQKLANLEELKKSILEKAFKGELI